MEILYRNSDNTKIIDFSGGSYEISDIDVFRHEFQYIVENEKITEFKTGVQEYSIDANVVDGEEKGWKLLYADMNAVFCRDILLEKPGTLHVNGSYMNCYIFASKPREIFEDWGFQTTELKIVTDRPVWTEEQKISIQPITDSGESADNNTYPYTYPYTYGNPSKTTSINIDHYAASDFRMIVYGPTANVSITINGHIYHVEYPIEDGEYMVIDSRSFLPPGERIYLVRQNGEKVNVFNYRDPVYSIFQKIPAGDITIDYSRKYGIDLIVFLERSEPKWK